MNGDGELDIVIANGEDTGGGLPGGSFLYLGPAWDDPAARVALPSLGARAVDVGDFDGDGLDDVALANGAPSAEASAWVYPGRTRWEDPAADRVAVGAGASFSVDAGDVDDDGVEDLLVAVVGSPTLPAQSLVAYGGDLGLDPTATRLAGAGSTSAGLLVDADGDGLLDAVLSTYQGSASYTVASLLHWNSKRGFEEAARSPYGTVGAYHTNASDLDGDGNLDLIVSNLYDGTRYALDSYIFWGTPTGPDETDRTQLPTIGARESCVGDLNRDGWPDIVFANMRNTSTFLVDSYIYWGGPTGYGVEARTALPTSGAHSCLLSDLDGDGFQEVIFANHFDATGLSSRVNSYVYWNLEGTFSTSERDDLPTIGAYAVAAADLNADGFLEVIFTNWFDRADETLDNDAYIYWGSAGGFSGNNRLALQAHGGQAPATVRDLDSDGFLDLVFGGYFDGNEQVNSYIYWGNEVGYSTADRTALPANRVADVEVGDINNNGYVDIVLATDFDGTNKPKSYVYWGSASRFSQFSRTLLSTDRCREVVIFDADRDGFLEVAFASYFDGDDNTLSRVFLATSGGLRDDRKVELPTSGAYYVVAADFDVDGLPDLAFANHINGSTYVRDSFIYWNSRHGFRAGVGDPIVGTGTREAQLVGRF